MSKEFEIVSVEELGSKDSRKVRVIIKDNVNNHKYEKYFKDGTSKEDMLKEFAATVKEHRAEIKEKEKPFLNLENFERML